MATEGVNTSPLMESAGLTYLIDLHDENKNFFVQGFDMKARLWSETASFCQVSRANLWKALI